MTDAIANQLKILDDRMKAARKIIVKNEFKEKEKCYKCKKLFDTNIMQEKEYPKQKRIRKLCPSCFYK